MTWQAWVVVHIMWCGAWLLAYRAGRTKQRADDARDRMVGAWLLARWAELDNPPSNAIGYAYGPQHREWRDTLVDRAQDEIEAVERGEVEHPK